MTSDQRNTHTASVGRLDDLAEGTMKMATVGERRVVVIRSASGVHALDNACPHQGYGMATGGLEGELLTCQWHNWKFDVRDGTCVLGEEDIACHAVTVNDGEIVVSVTEPTDEERREKLWPSLRRGIDAGYDGQIARDTARLVDAGAIPSDIVWAGVDAGASRTDYGIGHEMALAAECLALAEIRHGEDRVLPIVQGLSGIAEETRDRPVRAVPEPDETVDFATAIESEDIDGAMASVMASIHRGDDMASIRSQFLHVVSQHHLGYGHGIIYTQKAFEMLERVGWDKAPGLLPHLAATIGWSTREDLLPYMRKAMRSIDAVDLNALANAADRRATGWSDPSLVDRLLDATEAPIDLAVDAVLNGAGIEGLLDTISIASSQRLLRHDLDVELDNAETFGWLDITHALTTAQATRWAWRLDPGPHTARQALFAAWLLFDTGRAERRHGVRPMPDIEPALGDLRRAMAFRDEAGAMAHVMAVESGVAKADLAEASLEDQSGNFIVRAHLVKTALAAGHEADVTGSKLPLIAAARFLAAPKRERFVTRAVEESIDFVRTGRPPKR